MSVEVHLLSANAICPTKGSLHSAGYDLYCCANSVLPPGSRVLLPTGISLRMPSGVYNRIASRSGLAFNHCIDTAGGVIDPDYTGEIKVILVNQGDSNFIIKPGDRIAQIIFEKYAEVALTPYQEKIRNDKGFGSTNKDVCV